MRVCLLMLLALAATASADTGPLLMSCPPGWVLFHTSFEASCLKIMPEPKLFDQAFKACFDLKANLLSFSHRTEKIYFVNRLIMETNPQGGSLWFFDKTFLTPKEGEQPVPGPNDWMVISTSENPNQIKIMANGTVVPRNFICEAHAHPAAQRPQFQMEPEHLFIADFLVTPPAAEKAPSDGEPKKEQRPLIVTFNCEVYGLPKPSIEWSLLQKADNQSLMMDKIIAKVITDPREPLKEKSLTETIYYELKRDCEKTKCPPDSVQERSQLVVINPQFMDIKKSIVCIAKNDFGSVLSREANIFVTTMGEFSNKDEKVTIKSGMSALVNNSIKTVPDSAAADCYRVIKPGKDKEPPQLIPVEELNQMLHGAIQMSKATFDLIIDFLTNQKDEAGDYECRARLHNGRMGHVIREKKINLQIEPCVKADGCDLEAKPVKVVPGYPAVLSMNPLDNRIIRSGDDFLLECPCTGKRRPDEQLVVMWNRTDVPVIPVPVLPPGSALLVPRAMERTHSGEYKCQCARGQDKSEWHSVNVQVLPSTAPVELKEVLTAKLGDKVTLPCIVNTAINGLGVFVEPLRGVETVADYIARTGDSRTEIVRDGPNRVTVNFKDLKETDAGVYGCRVTVNYFGKWVEHDTFYSSLMVQK